MTNYECLKSLSQSELTDWLVSKEMCPYTGTSYRCENGECFNCISEWMKKEYKVDYKSKYETLMKWIELMEDEDKLFSPKELRRIMLD